MGRGGSGEGICGGMMLPSHGVVIGDCMDGESLLATLAIWRLSGGAPPL